MKFKHYQKQDILEVVEYTDRPVCYGFYQKGYYLAKFLKEEGERYQWVYIPLDKNDLAWYEDLKSGKSQVDSLTGRGAFLVTLNAKGEQIEEQPVKVSKELFAL